MSDNDYTNQNSSQEQSLTESKIPFFRRLGLLFGRDGFNAQLESLYSLKGNLTSRENGLKIREKELDNREAELNNMESELNNRESELDQRESSLDIREANLEKKTKELDILETPDPKSKTRLDNIGIAATTREFQLRILDITDEFQFLIDQIREDGELTVTDTSNRVKEAIEVYQARLLGMLSSYINRDGTTITDESRELYKSLIDKKMLDLIEHAEDKRMVVGSYIRELLYTKSIELLRTKSKGGDKYGHDRYIEYKEIVDITTDELMEVLVGMKRQETDHLFSPEEILAHSRNYDGYQTENLIRKDLGRRNPTIDPRSIVKMFNETTKETLAKLNGEEPNSDTKGNNEEEER